MYCTVLYFCSACDRHRAVQPTSSTATPELPRERQRGVAEGRRDDAHLRLRPFPPPSAARGHVKVCISAHLSVRMSVNLPGCRQKRLPSCLSPAHPVLVSDEIYLYCTLCNSSARKKNCEKFGNHEGVIELAFYRQFSLVNLINLKY